MHTNRLKEKQVVAIGGGHGLGRILAALQNFGSNATGIVATTDNGGSTGRIRECQGGIAWGDMRNCLNQLITEPSINSMMFEYRFKGSGELDGHNLGNLILAALDNMSVRPLIAINLIREILKVDVNILPMSEHPSDLRALSTEGKWIKGETSVDEMKDDLLRLDLDPVVPATYETIEKISAADAIILGPGSFLTSVMPPLLLSAIANAIQNNEKAKVVFIENLSPEYGPSGKMSFAQKLQWVERACNGRKVDVVIGPKATPEISKQWNYIETDLASPHREWRHDRQKLRQAIERLLQE